MRWPAHPFWDYSVELYARPGVEAACLELQRRHGLDVNLVLLACWLATRGIPLDQASVARAGRAVESWRREVVDPLRALRNHLKMALGDRDPGSIAEAWPDLVAAVRERALALELDAEHLAQLCLARAVGDPPAGADPGASLAGANLRASWAFGPDDRAALTALLIAAFPGSRPVELEAGLGWLGP